MSEVNEENSMDSLDMATFRYKCDIITQTEQSDQLTRSFSLGKKNLVHFFCSIIFKYVFFLYVKKRK